MSSTDASSEQMVQTPSGLGVDMALEVVTLPACLTVATRGG